MRNNMCNKDIEMLKELHTILARGMDNSEAYQEDILCSIEYGDRTFVESKRDLKISQYEYKLFNLLCDFLKKRIEGNNPNISFEGVSKELVQYLIKYEEQCAVKSKVSKQKEAYYLKMDACESVKDFLENYIEDFLN